MRTLTPLSLAALLALVQTTVFAAAPDCLQKCEKSKDQCMAQYVKSDSTSGRYVTPEGHKICWGGYHECKKNCPKPSNKR